MSRLVGFLTVGQATLAGGTGLTTVVSVDLAAMVGVPNVDNASIGVEGVLMGHVTGGGYGRFQLTGDFNRDAGAITQIDVAGAGQVQYSKFSAAVAAALAQIDFSGTALRMRVDDTGVVPTVAWTGYLWLYTSTY